DKEGFFVEVDADAEFVVDGTGDDVHDRGLHVGAATCERPGRPERPYRVPTRPLRPGRSLHGFTLIELLVVIAIIALLVALLLPALSPALQGSQHAACLSSVLLLSAALLVYSADVLDQVVSLYHMTGYGGGDTVIDCCGPILDRGGYVPGVRHLEGG